MICMRTNICASLMYSIASVRLFFFFQAEDGIRDYKVTGVQTCALPIYYALLSARSATVANSDSRTDMKRWRASWQGQWQQLGTALADELQLMASYQKSDPREIVTETRIGLPYRSGEHTAELQSTCKLVCRLLLE